MKKKMIILIVILFLVIVGSTYAIYTYATNDIISGVSECFTIDYVKGSDIGSASDYKELRPSSNYYGGLYASSIVSVKKGCTIEGTGTLYLDTDNATTDILLSSGALKFQVIENSFTLLNSGTISSKGRITLASDINVTNTTKQYSVSVWLDEAMLTDDNASAILESVYVGKINMRIVSK